MEVGLFSQFLMENWQYFYSLLWFITKYSNANIAKFILAVPLGKNKTNEIWNLLTPIDLLFHI